MRWISIGHRSSAAIGPATGRQRVVNKHSVTGGMKYLLWLIEVCTEVKELIPQRIIPLLLLLGFGIFILASDNPLFCSSQIQQKSVAGAKSLWVFGKAGAVSHGLKASSKLG